MSLLNYSQREGAFLKIDGLCSAEWALNNFGSQNVTFLQESRTSILVGHFLSTLEFLIAVLPWITVLAGNFLKIDKIPAPNKDFPGFEKFEN